MNAKQEKTEIEELAEKMTAVKRYEEYSYADAAENSLKIFSARKRGRGHVDNNKPCQDYSMVYNGGKYTLLTAADGVSSAQRSDEGARLACEAVTDVFKSLRAQSRNEEELVNRMQKYTFRKRVADRWVDSVFNAMKEKGEEVAGRHTDLYSYASTVMFALITPNFYVLGNVGDGQVIAYNDTDGVKLRVHSPKESSIVRALTDTDWCKESFQIKVLERKHFKGVLLTTDGIYDVTSFGRTHFAFTKGLEERCLEHGEPFEPFSFVEDGELKDLSERFTRDDCTVVLAVDIKKKAKDYDIIKNEAEKRHEGASLDRLENSAALFSFFGEAADREITAVEKKLKDNINSLSCAKIEKPVKEWKNKLWFREYEKTGAVTIEQLYNDGYLRSGKGNTYKIYKRLAMLEKELNADGMTLGANAHFLTGYSIDDDVLYIKREAIEPFGKKSRDEYEIWRYFDALLGIVKSESEVYELFDTGYVRQGRRIKDKDFKSFAAVEKCADKFMLKNLSEEAWLTVTGLVRPEESIELKPHTVFAVQKNGDIEQHTYYEKEELE